MSGRLFVIAAPSGAGKTSLVKATLARESNLRVCVSHTTRAKRPNEIDGRDYHFIDVPTFKALIAADGFLEYAPVFDNFYGTSRAALAEAFGRGHDVILEIDWQGARQVRERTRDATSGRAGCTMVFVLPPSRAELERRLRGRGTDDATVIARRLRDAVDDMSHYNEFDYVIINDDFERAVADLRRIVVGPADDLLASRPALEPLLDELLG
ncbi:MAG: guanylate kinase [Gammaproteobacteria bacterium]|jgi:guanylate kinase|nr:guanylate kinase [Gammaproteobacteria bacterium]MBM4225499.1 guanylate kinase [Gammaproteobacteria bacterium]MBM4229222.1 guanylate kinase [Gammaproteobacteria bacterium]